MQRSSATPYLSDIIQAIERIRLTMTGIDLVTFEADWQKQWLVERGIEIISEASRHLPDDVKSRHAAIPWPRVAAIGNVLRHGYHNIAAPIIWALVDSELSPLERACRLELAALLGEGPAGIEIS